jgi:hypothetical protein
VPHPTLYILKLGGNGFLMLLWYCGCFLNGTLVADPGSDQTQVSPGIAKSHRRCIFSLRVHKHLWGLTGKKSFLFIVD